MIELNLVHVSDFHASGSWFDPKAFEAGIHQIEAIEPEQIVFTGDLTDYGTLHEYEKCLPLFDAFPAPVTCVMGNHDAMREGWRIFSDKLLDGQRYYHQQWDQFRFFGLDSAEPDVNEGHIGREQMAWFEETLDREGGVPIVALHHHVIPVPYTGRERNQLLDSGEFLRVVDNQQVPLVLTGHKHQPWAWRVNDTVIATSGTFCSRKTNCGQNFNHIQIKDGIMTIDNVDVWHGNRLRLGRWELPQLKLEVSEHA